MNKVYIIIILVLTLQLNAQVNLSLSLSACYALNGNASEPINNLTGVLSAVTPTVNRFNAPNSAMYFSGVIGSIIKLPASPLIKPTNDVSFSIWVKPDALSMMEVIHTTNIYTFNFSSYALTFQNNGGGYKFRGYRQNGSQGSEFIDGTTVVTAPGNWYHVVLTIDNINNQMKIYVNGALENTVATTINNYNYQVGKEVILGGTNEPQIDPHYKGSMDNLRIYNRVINAAEVSALYTQDPACTNQVAPITSFSASQQICSGSSITFTNTSLNSPTDYTWTINGGSPATSTLSNPTSVFYVPGVYTVSLTTSNAIGPGNTAVQTITINPSPTVSVSSNFTICSIGTATFIASGANSYTWSNGGTGPSISVTANANSVYTVTGFGSSTLCYDTKTVGLTILTSPTISILGNTGICGSGTATLVANGADSYTWNTSSITNSITVSPTMTATYTVIGTNAATGCTNEIASTVIVSSVPQLSAANVSVCLGQYTTLNATGANTYTWNTGDITQTITVSPIANTIYTVSGSGSLASCIGIKTVEVSVLPAPILTISSSANTICVGKQVTFSVSGADFYVWSNGANGGSISVNPHSSSLYNVVGSINNMNCTSTKVVSVTVNPPASIYIAYDTLACDGDLIELKAEGAGNYVWNTMQTSPAISVVMGENKIYTVNGIDELTGCAGSSSVEINPSNLCCAFFIPNSFTPNDDGTNELFGPKTLCKFSKYKLIIFNRWGQKIFETDDQKKCWDGTYRDKACPSDIYVYLIEAEKSGKGFTATEKYLNLKGHITLFR
jgi:gliding motility-associated-like protein